MLIPLVALALAYAVGFIGSRAVRRPQRAAQAAAVGRSVGSSLGARRGLSAPELQRACFSEMARHVRVGRDGRAEVPGRFQLLLAPDDIATVDDARGWFIDGLSDALRSAAEDNGWRIEGSVAIAITADGTRRPGAPAAVADPPPAARAGRPAEAGAKADRLQIRRTDEGDAVVLADEPITIGRAEAATMRISDNRVSRSHAVVRRGDPGWTLTDLESANGTTRNGRLLTPNDPAPLTIGDTVGIGPFELVLEAAPQPERPAGRALDDHDRTRISGEVLPPHRRPGS